MRHVALFAGMGGFIHATEELGIDTVWANEIDADCIQVLRENFPELTTSHKSIVDVVKEVTESKQSKSLLDRIQLDSGG